MKSTVKSIMRIGGNGNTIPMGMLSTMKTLMGIGLNGNTIPMEIKSTLKILMGKLKTTDQKAGMVR